jgi:hypothetical protein
MAESERARSSSGHRSCSPGPYGSDSIRARRQLLKGQKQPTSGEMLFNFLAALNGFRFLEYNCVVSISTSIMWRSNATSILVRVILPSGTCVFSLCHWATCSGGSGARSCQDWIAGADDAVGS